MSIPRNELLKPSLSLSSITRAPYSVQTTFITAFFGGTFAILGMTGLNAWRLGRLGRDMIPLFLMLAAYLGFWGVLLHPVTSAVIDQALKNYISPSMFGIIFRLISLIFCGLGYLLHRNEQRSADVMGLDRPNGWIGGGAFIVGGMALNALLLYIIAEMEIA